MRKLSFLLVMLLLSATQLLAQRTITGKVTSADDGSGIPGVTVLVKGTSTGVLTDLDGKFSLSVPKTATDLQFTFVGMKPKEVALTAENNYDVVMETSAQQIEGVVVTAFGITRQSREIGVSTAKVADKELTRAGASNVMNGMTAKVSGLQINTINNGVNPETKITLRGNRHFLASNQALVVLDGVPVSATFLNSINPNDIESVSVLKGASASALYGNDASNGVMIVSTKKGGKQKPTIKVSNTTTFEKISYMPNLQNRFGSGSGETPGNADNNYTFWIGPDRNTDAYTSYENQQFGPEYNPEVMVILGGKLEDGSYQMVPYTPIKNQKKNFFETGVTMQNDVSYSGGDENSSFYLSAQDVKTSGTMMDDKNRRTSVRMSGMKRYGTFGADFSMGITKTKSNTSGGDMNQGRGVYWNVLNTPQHVPITSYKDLTGNPFATLDGYYNAYYPNPYWQIAHSRLLTDRTDFLGSMNLSWKPAEWLELSNRTGLVYYTRNYNDYVDEAVYSPYSASDPWSQGHMGQQTPYSGQSSYDMRNQLTLTDDFLAKFSKDFGDFTTKLILGGSVYSTGYNAMNSAASALVIPDLYNISNRVGEPVATQSTLERRSLGAFGDITLGYKNYIFLHASGRNDWDSRLVKENRSFFYPGADLSIVLTDMFPTLKDGAVLSFLKIRGGLSKTGLISLDNWYATVPSYVAAGGFPYGNTAGYRLNTTLSNPTLRPEITKELEGGIEFGFLKDRMHLEATVYKTNTIDQTIPAAISSATGFRSAFINAGELEGKGIEVDLRMTPFLNLGPVKWDLSFNYSYSTSNVISIFPGLNELPIANTSYAIIGQQFPAIKVSDVIRDPEGRIVVDAVTGLPKTAPALVQMGHANPNHILGIINGFSWKGLNLGIVAEYRTGNNIVNRVANALDFTGVSEHSALNGRQPFVIPNSVIETSPGVFTPNTDALVTDAGRSFWVNSNYHTTDAGSVTSAAFWKLREVSLSYDIPCEKVFGSTKVVKAFQVGLVGRNLVMWRPKTNVWTDPEFNADGATTNAVGYTTEDQTPPTRVMGFSVKLTF
jgi:TonB-linked SusC/RagA family outer membrane protein